MRRRAGGTEGVSGGDAVVPSKAARERRLAVPGRSLAILLGGAEGDRLRAALGVFTW